MVQSSVLGSIWVAGNRLPPETIDRYSTIAQPPEVPEEVRPRIWAASELDQATLPWVGMQRPTADELALIERATATFEN